MNQQSSVRHARLLLGYASNVQALARQFGLAAVPREPAPVATTVPTFEMMVRNAQIRSATRQLYDDGHYARAVEEAFKTLNNLVKRRSGLRDVDGDSLMRTALSAKAPRLRLNRGVSQSEMDEQAGYMDIFAGSMKGIRNPRAHDHELRDDPATALELLALASHLADRVETSTRTRSKRSRP